MDDFVPHIDGGAVVFQGLFDGIDSANYTGAETSGLGEDDFHGGFSRYWLWLRDTSSVYVAGRSNECFRYRLLFGRGFMGLIKLRGPSAENHYRAFVDGEVRFCAVIPAGPDVKVFFRLRDEPEMVGRCCQGQIQCVSDPAWEYREPLGPKHHEIFQRPLLRRNLGRSHHQYDMQT